jgi:predicted nucleic acid-binding protein
VIADFAIDTNIAVYALSEGQKCDIALLLLETGPSVSVQLFNEFINVNLRKRRLPWSEIDESLAIINSLVSSVRPLDIELHRRGREVSKRYNLGIYDSMIIAAALLDDCETLYSEDMQHGLIVEQRLTIINPFLTQPEPL